MFNEIKLSDNQLRKLIKEGKISTFQILKQIMYKVKDYTISEEKEIYALIETKKGEEQLAIKSKRFEYWVRKSFDYLTGKPVSHNSITEVIETISANVYFSDQTEEKLSLRVCEIEENLYIDLANRSGDVIKITNGKWSITQTGRVRFRRPNTMNSLATPSLNGDLNLLRKYIRLEEDNWYLLLGFIVGCFHPYGPYPILILQGTQGTGKSTLSKLIKSIVDPSSTLVRSLPTNERDLFISANSNHLLVFDNLSGLSADLSDALCKLSTGGGFSTKKLYTDSEEIVLTAKKPIILNGIDYISTRDDLTDRSIIIELPVINDENRLDERTFWDDFNKDLPKILGGLFNIIAKIQVKYKSIKLPEKPRMADFIQWVTTGEKELGLKPYEFLRIYKSNKLYAAYEAIEYDTLAFGIKTYLDSNPCLEGTATNIIRLISGSLRPHGINVKEDWIPPNKFKNKIQRIKPLLSRVGIKYSYARGNSRIHSFSINRSDDDTDGTVG